MTDESARALVCTCLLLESIGLVTFNRCKAKWTIAMRSNLRKLLPALNPALLAGLVLSCAVPVAAADDLVDAERLLKGGHPSEALAKVDTYIESKPRDPQGRFLQGLILTDMGHTEDAIVVFTALSEDFPELPEPYNNLAVLYAQQKQYDKARRALEMSIRTHPGYSTARENLGDVYTKLASLSYDQALQLEPSNKLMQSKLATLRGIGSTSQGVVVKQAAAPSPISQTSKRAGTEAVKVAAATAARPTTTAPGAATGEAPPPKPATVEVAQTRGETSVEAIGMTSTAAHENATAPVKELPRGVADKGWDLVFSPYTYHYSYSSDHKPVVLLGLTKGLEGRWMAGGAVFSNSFGQPSAYLFAGQRYVNPFGFENWYLQWNAGLLYGYVGEYQDKVPYNHNGFSPGLVASIGYQFNKQVYAEIDVLGGAGLMFSMVFPLPRDWP